MMNFGSAERLWEYNGRIAALFGKYDEAADMYAKALMKTIQRSPCDPRGVALMSEAARSLAALGDPDSAFDGLRTLAISYVRYQRYDLAQKLLDSVNDGDDRQVRRSVDCLRSFLDQLYKKQQCFF